jgi:serine protease Do
VVDDLRQYKVVQRAIIGVEIKDVDADLLKEQDLKLDDVKGVFISKIIPDGSAYDAGMKVKDVIVKMNGVTVGSVAELKEQVNKFRPGDKTEITYIRNGKETTVPIVMKNIDNDTKVVTGDSGTGSIFGATLNPVSSQEMKDLDIDCGVKVSEINTGTLKDLGIKKGYILTKINGKKVRSTSDVRQVTNNGQKISSIEGYQSDGTFFTFQFVR